MALDRVYYPHALRLPSPEITHLSSVDPTRGYQTMTESTAGSPHPCFAGVSQADPSISFTSRQLKSIIDTCTSSYLCRDLTGADVDLWYRAGKPMDIREQSTTAVHVVSRLTASAMLFWSTLRANQGSVAEIDAQIVTAKRGVADPMVWLGTQQLPAVAGCQRIFGLGPAYLNGVRLDGVTGWTLNTGAQLEPIAGDGERANIYQGIRNYSVSVSLQTNDVDQITDSSFGGDSFSTLVLYLQRYLSTNIYDLAASPTHIKITIAAGLRTVQGLSGTPAAANAVFQAIGDTPMVFDTASQIV